MKLFKKKFKDEIVDIDISTLETESGNRMADLPAWTKKFICNRSSPRQSLLPGPPGFVPGLAAGHSPLHCRKLRLRLTFGKMEG